MRKQLLDRQLDRELGFEHHAHGVHAGTISIRGRAPDRPTLER